MTLAKILYWKTALQLFRFRALLFSPFLKKNGKIWERFVKTENNNNNEKKEKKKKNSIKKSEESFSVLPKNAKNFFLLLNCRRVYYVSGELERKIKENKKLFYSFFFFFLNWQSWIRSLTNQFNASEKIPSIFNFILHSI